MTRNVRIIGVKRKQIDEEKLALAFLLLAKNLHDQPNAADGKVKPEQEQGEAA